MKDIIQAIDDGDNVLLTGGAGVGKTYTTNEIITQLRKKNRKFAVCALTGLASQHLHFGMTLHRFLGIGNKTHPESINSLIGEVLFDENINAIMGVSAIIIDEVSMMRSDLLALADQVLKHARVIHDAITGEVFSRRREQPFGGYQVIMVGDFCQLPPVVKSDERVPCKWIFQSPLFIEAQFRVYNLTEIKRTTDAEQSIMLNKLRVGYMDKRCEEIIGSRLDAPSTLEATVLMSRINMVNDYNKRRLESADGRRHILSGIVVIREELKESGDDKLIRSLYYSAISESGLEKDIFVKEGCRIMLLANNPKMGYSNGSQGKLLGTKNFDQDCLYFEDNSGFVHDLDFSFFGECLHILLDDGRDVVVPKKPFKVFGNHYDDEGRRVPDATFYQYPVVLGYAISIHKSQGMSLDKMFLDCQNIFADGQFYVGISRARSLEGLSITNFNPYYVRADRDAVNFYLQIAGMNQGDIFNGIHQI